MPLPSSGPISMSQVNVELGSPSTTNRSLNETAVRTLFGVPSGTISMSNGYGKANGWTGSVTISANTNNYDMRAAAVSAGWPGSLDANFTVTVNPGVFVGSSSTGSSAFVVGSPWPAGSTLTLVNQGTIIGRGGDGGPGGTTTTTNPKSPSGGPGSPGASGGPAFNTGRAITITNNGTIAGGGGGGGGGGSGYRSGQINGGGGGGGGIGTSSGGSGGTGSTSGQSGGGGSQTSAGGGGIGGQNVSPGGTGGTGGGGGSSGSGGSPTPYTPGGGAGGGGAAVSGNPFITWPATGTRLGPIS